MRHRFVWISNRANSDCIKHLLCNAFLHWQALRQARREHIPRHPMVVSSTMFASVWRPWILNNHGESPGRISWWTRPHFFDRPAKLQKNWEIWWIFVCNLFPQQTGIILDSSQRWSMGTWAAKENADSWCVPRWIPFVVFFGFAVFAMSNFHIRFHRFYCSSKQLLVFDLWSLFMVSFEAPEYHDGPRAAFYSGHEDT